MMSYSRRHANPIGRESVFLSELVRSLSRNEGQVPAEIIAGFRIALSGSSDDPRPEINRVYVMASYIASHLVPIAISLEGESREMLKFSERSEELALDNIISLEGYTRSARGLMSYFLSKEKTSEVSRHSTLESAEAEARKKYPDYPTDSPGVRAFKEKKRREVVEEVLEANKQKITKVVKRISVSALELAIGYCTLAEELSMEFESGATLSKEKTALAANLAAQLIVLVLSAVQFSAGKFSVPIGTAPVEQRHREATEAIEKLMSSGLTREAAIRELRASSSQYARGSEVETKKELIFGLERLARGMKIHHSRLEVEKPFAAQAINITDRDFLRGVEILVAQGMYRDDARKAIANNRDAIEELIREGVPRERAVLQVIHTGKKRTPNPYLIDSEYDDSEYDSY